MDQTVNVYEIIGEQVVRMSAMKQTIDKINTLMEQQNKRIIELEAQIEELTRP